MQTVAIPPLRRLAMSHSLLSSGETMRPSTHRILRCAGMVLALCFAVPGCASRDSHPRALLPELVPETAALEAIRTYDASKDGRLDAKELERCPALVHALRSYDGDGDGKLTSQEIANRLLRIKEGSSAFLGISCQVNLGDAPLAGAKVTFVPEAFMGSAFKPSTGVSDEEGHVDLQTDGMDVPGLYCGLYRVTVSKPNAQGKETIPARYNTQTTLGYEIAPDMREGNIYIRVLR